MLTLAAVCGWVEGVALHALAGAQCRVGDDMAALAGLAVAAPCSPAAVPSFHAAVISMLQTVVLQPEHDDSRNKSMSVSP